MEFIDLAADALDQAKKTLNTQYQNTVSQWNDSKSRELGDIVRECSSAMRNLELQLLENQKKLALLLKQVEKYESANISADGNSGSGNGVGGDNGGFQLHYSPEYTNKMWEESVRTTDALIDNYRQALLERGVPDGKWLSQTLASHRASMLEQAGYDLDVASGHSTDTIHNSNAYHYPGDYLAFYDQLASEFRTYCAQNANPNYNAKKYDEWYTNCQRCVPTYEMLRRGMDVTALPCPEGFDFLSAHPFAVWGNSDVISCSGNDRDELEAQMAQWGDGVRAQITVMWSETQGHTFIAEQRDGVTHYIDPQSGNEAYDGIDSAVPGMTQFCRIDTLEPSDLIRNCYRENES